MSNQHLTDTQFSQLEIPLPILHGIEAAGYQFCTPIQAETLPSALAGKDIAGQAQTGTGKTAAFLIAMLKRLMTHDSQQPRKDNSPSALILAPTRELAVQIHKEAEILAQHTEFTLCAVYGGTGYEKQRKQLEQGVDILIGTPGRIIDYFKQRIFHLKALQVLVLDEADRMFDLGFIKDIRYLLRRMPPPQRRLNMLFSATLSYRVTELAYEHMNNPSIIQIEPEQVTADKITQTVYYTANNEKIPLLLGLLNHMDPHRTIVFTNTKRAAETIWGYLEGNEIKSAILSGDVPQKARLRLLQRFQAGEIPVLVATDVAARGLHIPEVSHVINFDLPQDAEDYVHRVGRTARAGASGDAISFACEDYTFSLPEIETYIGHKLEVQSITDTLLVDPKPAKKLIRRSSKQRPGQGQKHSHKPAKSKSRGKTSHTKPRNKS